MFFFLFRVVCYCFDLPWRAVNSNMILQQGPRSAAFRVWGAKKISEVATYIKFEFSKHKIRTY